MTLQSYLWGLRIGTLISFAALCAVIFLTDPIDIGVTAFVLFYATFFFTAAGIGVLLLTWIWRRMAEDMLTLGEMGMAIRQGILLGLLSTIIVGLQQFKVLVWWVGIIAVVGVFLIELYFLTRQKGRNN
ncbi:MAG: hypothetical protein CR972_05175 [Candidatus Moraniibacteriota bacterium]|nr:MAG: hypothetical protein CR972_05175 [Candidatus Moranbacteria bacterium]